MRILIADSHALIRSGLVQVLKALAADVEVTEADTLEQALQALHARDGREPFDLMLVDLNLPNLNAAAGLKALIERGGRAPLVVIAEQDDSRSVEACMAAGALGYLPNSSSRDLILGAIGLVLSGGMYLPPTMLRQRGPRRREPVVSRQDVLPGALRHLTKRQQEVLELLSLGRSNKDIAQALGLAEGTVKIHVSAILKALGVANRTEATARTLGSN